MHSRVFILSKEETTNYHEDEIYEELKFIDADYVATGTKITDDVDWLLSITENKNNEYYNYDKHITLTKKGIDKLKETIIKELKYFRKEKIKNLDTLIDSLENGKSDEYNSLVVYRAISYRDYFSMKFFVDYDGYLELSDISEILVDNLLDTYNITQSFDYHF